MTSYLFTNGRVLQPEHAALIDGLHVLVEDGQVREVSDTPIKSNAEVVDLRGKTLMPGLIDCHVHVNASLVNIGANAMLPSSLAALRSARIMEAMLQRGFTTVRDLGGADLGLVQAVEEGLIAGPRLIICGKALSPTGGHGDFRARSDDRDGDFHERVGSMSRVVDGVDAIRCAAREEVKAGAQFIKLMANGGVASPNDPIHALGFSVEEIEAAVEEADNAGLYVSAHLYTDRAIARAVDCGVHSLEHCNLIRPDTAKRAAERGCIAVPTLVAYESLALEGAALGLPPESAAKIETVRKGGMESLAIMREAGLPMAFGSDLLGGLMKFHSMEFEILSRALPASEIIASATTVGAKLCRMEGKIGTIAPGAFADLIVVDGDPLADITLLAHDGAHMPAIMARGVFRKNELN
ncbi:MAG TPA: amidohydrolase family protein [Bauldia sp.]|nr:amidohydrolase family protein [Bauldia sp.]